ncbi:hypothetical protein F2Q69_00020418 [Brassica cretica]|uniref:Uncharacterized protein n=1 Tax=Brassica cretica TaxID=69181 RepID=A0A8S9QC05_BRACR|nr:hypothetical protein F2Q69_00020418 [Brassica cretica]
METRATSERRSGMCVTATSWRRSGTQRPRIVAPRGRSRLRERPGGVAARRRPGPVFVSPSDENASDFSALL